PAGERTERTEGDGVMRDDQVASQGDGLHHHIFSHVDGQQHTGGLSVEVATLQAAIVILLLQWQRCQLLNGLNDLFDAHSSSGLVVSANIMVFCIFVPIQNHSSYPTTCTL